MSLLATIAVTIVALLHLGFFYLEAFLWATPTGMKIFKLTAEQAQSSATLAANQGVYNALLGIGLITAMFLTPAHKTAITTFVLVFIVLVGIYGAATVSGRIFLLQSLPALIALGFSWLVAR